MFVNRFSGASGWADTAGRATLYTVLAYSVVGVVHTSGASPVVKLVMWISVSLLMITVLVLMFRVTAEGLRAVRGDQEGIRLRIDEEGVYFGGADPFRVEWSKIEQVLLDTGVDANSTSDPDIRPPSYSVIFCRPRPRPTIPGVKMSSTGNMT